MPHPNIVLSLSCRDQPGIVAAVAKTLFDAGCNIVEAHQFNDGETHLFFMRVRLVMLASDNVEELRAAFQGVAEQFSITWTMRNVSERQRVMILVSKFDHCLADLLYRWRTGEIAMDIAGIIANHPRETYTHLDFDGIPFHYLPVTKATKMEQEAQVWDVIRSANTDLVVLARYMQILSDGFCAKLAGRCINIHHSFLPGFKGAKPYHQAFARGVKLIGATAHYVTTDLDEGPIVEQEAQRVDHANTVDELVAMGRDIENLVLSRAVRYHIEHRVLINGAKTVVFK